MSANEDVDTVDLMELEPVQRRAELPTSRICAFCATETLRCKRDAPRQRQADALNGRGRHPAVSPMLQMQVTSSGAVFGIRPWVFHLPPSSIASFARQSQYLAAHLFGMCQLFPHRSAIRYFLFPEIIDAFISPHLCALRQARVSVNRGRIERECVMQIYRA